MFHGSRGTEQVKKYQSERKGKGPLYKLIKALAVLNKSATPRYITLAGMFRKFSDMIVTCYLPVFFMSKYPTFKATYALLGALSLAILGFCSNLIGGIVSDRFEDSNPTIKTKMLGYSALISLPLVLIATLAPGGFWVSFLAISGHSLVSGGYSSIAITMIQNSVKPKDLNSAISAYNLFTNVS